uniref:Uncharacterized protein n=1 Tax=Caenorhabditis tropicalis TaxID=1561998 RepID=A0A1I7UC31_9PELO
MDNSASSTTTSSNEAMIQPNSVHDRPPSDFIDNFEIPRNSLIDRYIDEQRRNRRTEADIEAEYMRRRIGNFEVEQPTRIKLLQNTLLQVAMAVERNSYAHISNVFEDLSRMFDN